MEIRFIQHHSPEYGAMISLRMEVLLQPINIPESFIDKAKEKADILIGAFDNNQLIGCCILTAIDQTQLQLRQMAVRSDYQAKGIGSTILRFAEQQAIEKGFSILMMHARDAAVPFYRKSGYVVTGDPFDEVGIMHFTMTKKLV